MSKEFGCMQDENRYLDHIRRQISKTPVLIDVGMNEGRFTQEFLSRYPYASVYGFEPIKELCKVSTGKFLDKLYDKVYIYNVAIGKDFSSCETFYVPNKGMECSSFYVRPQFPGNPTTTQVVPLDFYEHIFPPDIDYLKIDVEGFEFDVLVGAKELIRSNRIKYIQFEVGDTLPLTGLKFCDIMKLLEDHYKVYDPNMNVIDSNFKLGDILVRNYLAERLI